MTRAKSFFCLRYLLAGFLGSGLAGETFSPAALGQETPAKSSADKAKTPLAEIAGAPAPPPRPARSLEESPAAREACEAARDLLEEGKPEDAAARLEEITNRSEGDFYEVFYLLALAHARLERFGPARTAAEYAAGLRPGAADVHYLLGQLYQRQPPLDRAIAHFRSATLAAERESNNPRVTAAWYELGRCLAQGGRLAAAAEAYERFDLAIWDSHPEHRETEEVKPLLAERPDGAFELRIDLLRRLDRPADAVAVAAWAVKNQPKNPQYARLYVQTLLETKQAGEALAFCRQRLDESAASEGLLTLAVRAAREAKQLDAWLAETETRIAADGLTPAALRLARRLEAEGLSAEAARLWRAVSRKQPDNAEAVWSLANALRAGGDLPAALDALIDFVRRAPQAAAIAPPRPAEWMKTFKETDKFLALVATYTQRADRDFATDFVLGVAATAAQQLELAEKLFRACLAAKPDFALAHVAWAQALAADFRWEEAKQQAAAAVKLAPDLAAAHFALAQAHDGLDENEAAEKAYKDALRLAPRNSAYNLAVARFYRRLENHVSSQRYFQQTLAAEPGHAEALEELIDSYLAGGKREVVETYAKNAAALDLPEDVLRRIRTAVRFAQTPFQPDHAAELRRQFEQHPDDILTGLKLGAALYLTRQADEAFQVLEKVRARDPQDERTLGLLARIQSRRLAFDAAIGLLETLRRRNPNRLDVCAVLAENYLHDFQPEKARPLYQKILGMKLEERERFEYRAKLIGSYVEFAEYAGALDLLDEWLKGEPKADWPAVEKMRVLLAAGRLQEAFELAAARLDRAPESVERREEFVRVAKEARQYKKGEERVRAWLAQQPGDVRVLPWLMEILLADQRADEALKLISELQPKSASGEFLLRGWRVRCLAAAKRYDDAVEELDHLLDGPVARANPGQRSTAREQLVRLLIEAERYDEALRRCDRWLAQAGEGDAYAKLESLVFKRTALLSAGRSAEAVPVTEKLLEFQPNDAGMNNDLGYEWVDQGKHLEKATRMIRDAVADSPLQPAFLDSLGWAYYKAGDFSAARKYLARATRLRDGRSPAIYDHLGDTDFRLGDRDAARRSWRKTLELLEDASVERGAAERAKLGAAARAKLTALDRSEPPPVAPLAAGK